MYVSGFKNINMELEDLNLPLDLNIEGPSTRYFIQTFLFNFKKIMVELGGLEPPTFSLQMRRSSQVNYSPIIKTYKEKWWACQESNLGPQSYQDCALTN